MGTAATQTAKPMDFRRLFPIVLIIFTNVLGAGVILPILPLYAEGQFGGTVFQITLLAASFFAAQFVAAPWLGRLSDRYGRRPVLIFSQLGTVFAFLLFIFAGPIGLSIDASGLELPLTGGMVMLFVARILDGMTGGNITTAQAYVSDLTSEADRAQGLGLLQAGFGMGFIFGPAFGGVLSGYGPVAPFIGATVITTGTLLLTTFTLQESLPPSERRVGQDRESRPRALELLRGRVALHLVLAIGFTTSLAFAALPATFALYADRVLFSAPGLTANAQLYIGLMLTFLGLVTVVTQLAFLRPLIRRLGERRLLVIGQAALLLAFLGLGSASAFLIATASLAPFAFGRGVSEPSIQSLVTRFGDRDSRGQLLGFYQSARSLALIVGPIWAGYVFEAFSARAVYWTGAGIVLVAMAFGLLLLRQTLPTERAPAHPGAAEEAVPSNLQP